MAIIVTFFCQSVQQPFDVAGTVHRCQHFQFGECRDLVGATCDMPGPQPCR